VPESVVDLILEIDSILTFCHTSLSGFQKPQAKNESDHTVAKLLDECCCAFWRARRIRGMGDFCPDCYEHNASAGMQGGEIKIIRPPTSLWKKKRV